MQSIVEGTRWRALLPVLCAALALLLAVGGEQARAQSPGAKASVTTLAPGAGFDGRHRGAVMRIQRRMLRLGYAPGPVDGLYGPLTTAAVQRLQAANGVAVDGVAGPVTRRALAAQSKPRPARVRHAQRRLRALGHRPGPVDGIFGAQTVGAVRDFLDAENLRGRVSLAPRVMARLDAGTQRSQAPQDKPTAPPPATTTDPPAATTEPPATTSEPPATTEPPATATEPPAATTEPPAATTEPPATTTEPPAAKTEPPAAKTEPPASTTEPPAATTEPPATTTEPPATTTEPPAATTEPPASTTEAPAVGSEAPAPTETVPPLPTPAPPVAPAGSVTTTPDPAAAQQDPGAAPSSQTDSGDGGSSLSTPLALLIGSVAILAFLIGRDSGPPLPRPATFRSGRTSAFAGLLSLAAIGVVVLVVLLGRGCGTECAENGATVLQIAYVVTGIAAVALTACLVALYVAGRARRRRAAPKLRPGRKPLFVIVIPARNEELTIGDTVHRVLELPYRPLMAMVVNDGSTDGTCQMAQTAAAGDARLVVVNIAPEHAGRGKAAALDHAYQVLAAAASTGHEGLGGAQAEDIVIGVLDPGARFAADALSAAAPHFSDPQVAEVRVPIRIANARDGVLARMQDVESVMQAELALDEQPPSGDPDLPVSGQLVRLAALRPIGGTPWTTASSREQDLGALLSERGGQLRTCAGACVAEPGTVTARDLLRGRIPSARRQWWLAPAVLLACIHAVLVAGDVLGVLFIQHGLIARLVSDDLLYRIAVVAVACAPLVVVAVVYMRATVGDADVVPPKPRLWSVPGLSLLFAAYTLVGSTVAATTGVLRRSRPAPPEATPADGRPAVVANDAPQRQQTPATEVAAAQPSTASPAPPTAAAAGHGSEVGATASHEREAQDEAEVPATAGHHAAVQDDADLPATAGHAEIRATAGRQASAPRDPDPMRAGAGEDAAANEPERTAVPGKSRTRRFSPSGKEVARK